MGHSRIHATNESTGYREDGSHDDEGMKTILFIIVVAAYLMSIIHTLQVHELREDLRAAEKRIHALESIIAPYMPQATTL